MLLEEYGVQVSDHWNGGLPGFASWLASRGYCWLLIQRALFVLAFVSHWLARRRLRPGSITAEQVAHLRRARRGDGNRLRCQNCWSSCARSGRFQTCADPPRTALDRLLDRYREHLAHERGLSDGVVRWYGMVAGGS